MLGIMYINIIAVSKSYYYFYFNFLYTYYTELDYPKQLPTSLQVYPVLLTLYYKLPRILEVMLCLVPMK